MEANKERKEQVNKEMNEDGKSTSLDPTAKKLIQETIVEGRRQQDDDDDDEKKQKDGGDGFVGIRAKDPDDVLVFARSVNKSAL